MQSVWEEIFEVKSYEVDNQGYLKIYSLFNYLQETAGNHAQHLGWGYEAMIERNLFWVLARVSVEIKQLPKWRDKIRVTTSPKGVEKIFGIRDFLVSDEAGNTLISVSTGWLIIDAKTFKAQNVAPIVANIPINEGRSALKLNFEKIHAFSESVYEYQRKVSYNEIDVNNHVNNARYIEWIMDCFESNFIENHKVKHILVSYVGEAKYGDLVTVTLTRSNENENLFCMEANVNDKNKKVLQTLIEW